MKNVVILSITLFLLISVGCRPPSTLESTPTPIVHPGKAIVISRCIGCHNFTLVEDFDYDQEGWQMVVDSMILYGAQLSVEQVSLAVEYLAQTYPKE